MVDTPVIELTDKQKRCKHIALKIRSSTETYISGYSAPDVPIHTPKAEIVCADCGVVVARAGTIWINLQGAVRGIIEEHYPSLIYTKYARTH